MKRFLNAVRTFVREQDAPTSVEYGVMVALIAAVVIAGATILGQNTNAIFQAVAGIIGGVPGG